MSTTQVASGVYCPVVTTPQDTLNVMVASAGKVPSSNPPAVSKLGHWAAAGQAAAMGRLDGVQAVTVQLRPALGTSLTVLPSAAVAPLLVNVTVWLVVEPAATVVVPFVFCTSSWVEQVVVAATTELVMTEAVPDVANQALMGAIVGVSTPFAPPVALMLGRPAELL